MHIRASKTDQTKVGVDLYVGRTENAICPVAAMMAYLAVRGHGVGPLLVLQDGCTLTRGLLLRSSVSSQHPLGQILWTLIPDRSGNNCNGKRVSESTVQTPGRWVSDSFKRYIRISRQELAEQMLANMDR